MFCECSVKYLSKDRTRENEEEHEVNKLRQRFLQFSFIVQLHEKVFNNLRLTDSTSFY